MRYQSALIICGIVNFFHFSRQTWVHISICRNYGGRSNLMLCVIRSAFDAGSTDRWPLFIVLPAPQDLRRLTALATRQNKVCRSCFLTIYCAYLLYHPCLLVIAPTVCRVWSPLIRTYKCKNFMWKVYSSNFVYLRLRHLSHSCAPW